MLPNQTSTAHTRIIKDHVHGTEFRHCCISQGLYLIAVANVALHREHFRTFDLQRSSRMKYREFSWTSAKTIFHLEPRRFQRKLTPKPLPAPVMTANLPSNVFTFTLLSSAYEAITYSYDTNGTTSNKKHRLESRAKVNADRFRSRLPKPIKP